MRRVVVLKDAASPLWFLRCQVPCEHRTRDGRWCMDMGHGERGCYLGGGMSPEGARIIAARAGYEVVDA